MESSMRNSLQPLASCRYLSIFKQSRPRPRPRVRTATLRNNNVTALTPAKMRFASLGCNSVHREHFEHHTTVIIFGPSMLGREGGLRSADRIFSGHTLSDHGSLETQLKHFEVCKYSRDDLRPEEFPELQPLD
jgi:hypothetical protein